MKKHKPTRKQINTILKSIGTIYTQESLQDFSDDTTHIFSQEYMEKEQQMLALLSAHTKKQRRRRVLVPVVVALSLLLLSLTIWGIFMITEQQDHADISLETTGGSSAISVRYIPDGFFKVDSSSSEKYSYSIYENTQGDMLRIMFQTGSLSKSVDTEDRDTEHLEINGNDAYLTFDPENGDSIIIIYFVSCSVSIEGDIDRDTAVLIGESIELR